MLDPLGGGLPRANCKTILSQDYPACPPRTSHRPEDVEPRLPIQTEIDKAFKAIRTQLGKGKGRRLYVYFSGHGLGRNTLGADLCMAQWSKDFWRNAALDSEDYQKKVIASGYFRELVFFLDCCRVREVNARGRGSEFDWPMTGEGAEGRPGPDLRRLRHRVLQPRPRSRGGRRHGRGRPTARPGLLHPGPPRRPPRGGRPDGRGRHGFGTEEISGAARRRSWPSATSGLRCQRSSTG